MLRVFFFLCLMMISSYASADDAVLKRIVKNKEINCGVYVLGSLFSYDTNNKPKGFTVALMDEVSRRTGFKVKYTELSSFATLEQEMDSGKFDMICTPTLLFPSTIMRFLPSTYIAKDVIEVYANKETDISKIKKFEDLNDPSASFVGMDGELGGMYVPKVLPNAKLTMLPQGASPSQMFLELDSKKSKYVVLSRVAAKAFLKEHPDKIKLVVSTPIVSQSVHLFYPLNSLQLKANIDAILDGIEQDGLMKKMLKEYDLLF